MALRIITKSCLMIYLLYKVYFTNAMFTKEDNLNVGVNTLKFMAQ